MTDKELYDVTIIGGGPAGLYSAFYSGLREMKTKIIEFQPYLGGKVHVYPEKMIWDIGGLPPLPGQRFIEQMIEQGLTFSPEVILNEKVTSITKSEQKHFKVHTASDISHHSKTVIVATGSGILKPQKLDIEGAQKFEKTNMHYTVRSLKSFQDKTVIISGGGNAAIDWANELKSIAKRVFIICRNDAFKCHESQATQLHDGSIVCIFNSQITKLVAGNDPEIIAKVEITNYVSGAVNYLPIDEVIVSHGYERDLDLLKNSGLQIEMTDEYFIKTNENSESSIPGLYAAGDIMFHEGKLNLIAGAFQDAGNAVNKAKQFIQPDAEKTAMVSTHNELFKKRNSDLIKKMID